MIAKNNLYQKGFKCIEKNQYSSHSVRTHIENSKRFMKDIEITIKNDYINIWRQATTSAPKLRTYITF